MRLQLYFAWGEKTTLQIVEIWKQSPWYKMLVNLLKFWNHTFFTRENVFRDRFQEKWEMGFHLVNQGHRSELVLLAPRGSAILQR